jgi:ABC-type dipeptide/oligopeptide/nickel transport system permease subunit
MESTTIIRIVAAIAACVVFLAFFGVAIAYILTLSNALKKCSASARTMQPGMVWLLLVPILNIIWNFLVVSALAQSLANEFRLRGAQNVEPEPGKSIGLPMSICAACGLIPFLGILAGLAI